MMTLPRVSLVAAAAIAASLLFSPSADARKRGGFGDHEPTAAQKEVRELRKTIAATELFFALDLSPDQKGALGDLIADAIAEREARQAARAADAPELADLLEDYLDEIDEGGSPSADTVAALKAFREDHKPDREARRGGRGEMREVLQAILTEEQLETLKSFKPMAELHPSDEEREAHRGERRERFADKAQERGFDEDRAEELADQRMKRGDRRRGRRGAKKAVHILLSPKMLALLD